MEEKNASNKRLLRYADYLLLAILALATVVVVVLRLKLQMARTPGFDTYAFLDNALNMAGKSSYFEINRPPVLPFLTSLLFRLGLDSELAIYLIDSFFFVVGVVGLYLLARLRLSSISSLVVGLIFISFPDIVENVTFGITDVVAISFSIWLIYFTVVGAEKNPRYYLLVPPLFVITFFTRYTAAVMIFPLLFYLLLQGNVLRGLRFLSQGLPLALLAVFADLVYYYVKAKGDLFVQFSTPYAVATTIGSGKAVTEGPAPSRFYFVEQLPEFLSHSVLSYTILLFFVVGLAVFFIRLVLQKDPKRRLLATLTLLALLASSVYLAFSSINFLLANSLLLIIFLLTAPSLLGTDREQTLLLLILFWFLTFLSYHSHQAVKVSRYFITMAPAVALFVGFGFEWVLQLLEGLNLRRSYRIIATVPLVIAMLVFSSVATDASYQRVKEMTWTILGLKEANEWVRDHSKSTDVVFADYFVASAWYTRRPIKVMPTFKNRDRQAVNHELEKSHADYYVSVWYGEDFPSYQIVKRIGDVRIFKRKPQPLPSKPKIFLIGMNIDHYIEDILNFKFYVIRNRTPFADDFNRSVATTYVDEYSIGNLKKYKILLLYNFRWHKIETAEALLREYLNGGGTIIIDTSGNSGSISFDLSSSTFLGATIIKEELPPKPTIWITESYDLARGVDPSKFSPFLTEQGGVWTGSAYRQAATSTGGRIEKLAGVNGKTLIGLQQYRKGRIIWIGYNLIFHASYYENKNEEKLVQNVFGFATLPQ